MVYTVHKPQQPCTRVLLIFSFLGICLTTSINPCQAVRIWLYLPASVPLARAEGMRPGNNNNDLSFCQGDATGQWNWTATLAPVDAPASNLGIQAAFMNQHASTLP